MVPNILVPLLYLQNVSLSQAQQVALSFCGRLSCVIPGGGVVSQPNNVTEASLQALEPLK